MSREDLQKIINDWPRQKGARIDDELRSGCLDVLFPPDKGTQRNEITDLATFIRKEVFKNKPITQPRDNAWHRISARLQNMVKWQKKKQDQQKQHGISSGSPLRKRQSSSTSTTIPKSKKKVKKTCIVDKCVNAAHGDTRLCSKHLGKAAETDEKAKNQSICCKYGKCTFFISDWSTERCLNHPLSTFPRI